MDENMQDLLRAAGQVMTSQLNTLPVTARRPIVDALDAGGWTELRIGLMNRSATVRIVVCNTDGDIAEITRSDISPPSND